MLEDLYILAPFFYLLQMTRTRFFSALCAAGLWTASAQAQVDTNIIAQLQKEAANSKQMELLGMELMDDIGPRLMGSPQLAQASNWLVSTYKKWGIAAHSETYGTWKGWERGETEVVMMAPRKVQLQ